MKELFHIAFEADTDKQKVLSVRLGKHHICFSTTNKSATELYSLTYYSIENWNEKVWQEIIEGKPEFGSSFYEILVAYDFPESLLISSREFKTEDATVLLQAAYGVNNQSVIITEAVTGWPLHNLYAVPGMLKEWLTRKFPAARFWHQYSLDIRNMIGLSDAGKILVDFRKTDFSVIAANKNNILLSQTFEYSTPEDVLFYLIKLCNQFSFSREHVELKLSGLIDKQSSLYKELYQYFINIEFRNASWNAGNQHPAHFFTSLNDLAQCVS